MGLREFSIDTPIGVLYVASDGDVVKRISMHSVSSVPESGELSRFETSVCNEIKEYFDGRRRLLEFAVDFSLGTPFQQRVWNVLREIPYGATLTYSQVARLAGSSAACRAVGSACNRNPLLLAVPCHRVVGASGKLVGFACGLEVKDYLLRHEAGFL